MFAGAAREAVFANPAVIKKVKSSFVAVSVKAADMHRPSGNSEATLLRAIGATAPAPQGIAVLNSDGQPLAWSMMFDDDAQVLAFLDHAIQRFQATSRLVLTEQYMRFPSVKRGQVTAGSGAVSSRHASEETCLAAPTEPKGAVVADVVGRVLDPSGKLTSRTVNQEEYAQDRFVVDLVTQADVAVALVGSARVRVPNAFARLVATYAYLGPLDVRPITNPSGGPTEVNELEFWATPVESSSGLWRLEGVSDLSGRASRADGATYRNSIQLKWRGFVRLAGNRITDLALVAEGDETLQWRANELGKPRGPEVAQLPAGRPIDFKGKVRYGILGTSVK